ncbi:sensor domain-containing diguanylate cyclase [Photobacterium minamisatsumaniensis]|uniref:sensor domain-containing diguanylate cyclase n=1 Tax=Photobacterium minamisatsumaniensis TaxID=2910233 RepID=UPI003D10E43A
MTVFVLLTALPIGLLWYQSSEKIVLQTIERLYLHSSKSVKAQLDNFFSEADHVYLHQERYNDDLPKLIENQELLFEHIVHMLNHHNAIDYFYFSNLDGGLLSFGIDPEKQFTRIESDSGMAGPLSSYATDYYGKNKSLIKQIEFFDARERDWYKNALKSERAVWSNIYPGAIDNNILGISLTKALRDESGTPLGVWGIDLTLNSVINKLKGSKLSENGSVAIIDEHKKILASTDVEHAATDGKLQYITEEDTPILYQLTHGYKQNSEIIQNFTHDGNEWVGFVTSYPIGPAYNLSLVFYSPVADFSPTLIAAKNSAIAFTSLMVILALYFGRITTVHILSPIKKLTQAAKQISLGRKESINDNERDDELGQLATSFNQMTSNLANTISQLDSQQKETARLNALLEAQNNKLEEQVKTRTNALISANNRLKKLAYFDTLTGIANRRHFWEQFEVASTINNGWLLILDLDNFKTINDNYGHLVGDEVLKHFTHICQQVLDKETLMGRIGGEEFAIWYPQTNREHIYVLTENIMMALRASPYYSQQHTITVSVSIGASFCIGNTVKAYTVADKLLYEAKHAGKSRAIIEKILS